MVHPQKLPLETPQHMVHPQLRLVPHPMDHPLAMAPPPQRMEARDKRSPRLLAPREHTLVLEPPVLTEVTKNPHQQRHCLQPQQGALHSLEDTPVLLLSLHLLFLQRGKSNTSSLQSGNIIDRSGDSVARTALTVEPAGTPRGRGMTRTAL